MQQIIALGGGGFSMEPDNPALDLYLLQQARRRNPSICFLGTATGDNDGYIARFYAAFSKHACRPTHVPLFSRTPQLEPLLPAQDIIFVGGGNTKSMLAVWREYGIPAILRRALKGGTVLAGISAGAICWFDWCITDSWAGKFIGMPALGFLPGTGCPHYDGEGGRRPVVHDLVQRRQIPTTLAMDDSAAAHFINGALHAVVASRPNAGAYIVTRGTGGTGAVGGRRGDNTPVETPLPTTLLARDGTPARTSRSRAR